MPPTRDGAVELFGVISLDGAHQRLPSGVSLVPFRDLAALVCDAAYVRAPVTPERVQEYRRVIETAFAHQTVLPAPCATVFRNRDTLTRWLELHYFTLLDALGFVQDRVMGRVTVRAAEPPPVETPDGEVTAFPRPARVVDVQTSAAESFRVLRRHAASAAPVTPADAGGSVVAASFLVERDRWAVFSDVVREEGKRVPDLLVECTGPWPPYDFVRMQFGG